MARAWRSAFSGWRRAAAVKASTTLISGLVLGFFAGPQVSQCGQHGSAVAASPRSAASQPAVAGDYSTSASPSESSAWVSSCSAASQSPSSSSAWTRFMIAHGQVVPDRRSGADARRRYGRPPPRLQGR